MGDGGLGEVEERHELTDANLAGVLSKHVHELHPDRIAQSFGDAAHALRVLALDVGIYDRLTADLALRALLLRGEFKGLAHALRRSVCIEVHQYNK